MRKLLLVILLGLFFVPSVFARRHSEKAGKVQDYVYTDSKYDFSLKLSENWKYKIEDKDAVCRLILTQVKYAVPPDYLDATDYTKIPRMVVAVVNTDMRPADFIDSLVSNKYKSEEKKELLKEFEILNISSGTGFKPEELVPRKRKMIEINGLQGVYWTGQVQYTNEVAVSASSVGGKRVKGAYGGMIIALKKDNQMLLFHTISEWMYFEEVSKEVMGIINTLKW